MVRKRGFRLGLASFVFVLTGQISDLVMGLDGTSLCATSGDGTLAVYDVRKSGEKVRQRGLTSSAARGS